MLRLLRSNPPKPAPFDPTRASLGLEGFGSETNPVSGIEATTRGSGSRWLIALLAVVAIAEAVPTALWARDYMARGWNLDGSTVPPAAAATLIPGTPLGIIAAPCEAAAAPAPSDGPAAAVAAAPVSSARTATAAQPIAAGILAITAPLPMHVYSKGRLLGTTEADSLMLPLGAYELELVNESVGYRERRTVSVQAGRRTALRIDPPSGRVNINAVPWAEVWMDNQRVGETPIGNLEAPIGTRELVFRHPELGERRTRVLVTLKEAARVSVDLRKP